MFAIVATATVATTAKALTSKYEKGNTGEMTDVILNTASTVIGAVKEVTMVVYNKAPSSEELIDIAANAMDTATEALDTATKAIDTVTVAVNSVLGNDKPKQTLYDCPERLLANAICPGTFPIKKNNGQTSQMNP
tara:strand:- start:59 stop:463 length:405 start_codon:yes stop_codon:yes gene_type:complete